MKKSIYKLIGIMILFAGVCLGKFSPCFAYLVDGEGGGSGGHHEQITDYSIDFLDYGDANLKGTIVKNREAITKGTREEDDGANWFFHFYDPSAPSRSTGLFGVFGSAEERAGGLYEKAKKSKSWETLGHALHLLQDMASPSHVHNASHWQHNTLWKRGYEWWVTANWYDRLVPYFNLPYQNPDNRRPFLGGDMEVSI